MKVPNEEVKKLLGNVKGISRSAGTSLPTTLPKLVQPGQSNTIPFEQVLSNKLHSSLVIPSTVPRKQTIISRSSTLSTVIPLSSLTPLDTKPKYRLSQPLRVSSSLSTWARRRRSASSKNIRCSTDWIITIRS
jgi:hypothetical protein